MSREGFQSSARRQGAQFERTVETLLLCNGWRITGPPHWVQPEVNIEIDITATDPAGIEWWVECKGSWESESGRNGLKRTDTAKKALGSAAILRLLPEAERRPYMVVTSHLPRDGAAACWLEKAEGVYIDRLWVTEVGPGCCNTEEEPPAPKARDRRRTAEPPQTMF